MPAKHTTESEEGAFWAKVYMDTTEAGCWLWTGAMFRKGYGNHGTTRYGRKQNLGAHRFAWVLAHGEIPAGLCVLHRCDNPPCVRPDHMFLGTRKDNTRDMIAKGRANFGGNSQPFKGRQPPKGPRLGSRRPNAKLSERDIPGILRLLGDGLSQHRVAGRFGVAQSTITEIVHGRTWRHVTGFEKRKRRSR